MPKVSVVMPVYNGEKYLREAIDSIVAQTFTDWEFIIVNEFGSDDGSASIVAEYAKKDERFHLVQNEKKLGLAESLNVGFRQSKGEYIARMDADDLSHPERFAKQVVLLDANPHVGICGTWQHHFGKDTDWVHKPQTTSDGCMARLLFNCDLCHSTLMLRRKVIFEHNLFYDNSFSAEDYELWCRAMLVTDIVNIPEVLGEYRIGADNITASKKQMLDVESGQLVARNLQMALGITLDSADHELFQGWSNPFDKFPNEIRQIRLADFERILRKIYAVNNRKQFYREADLLTVLAGKWRWAKYHEPWDANREIAELSQIFDEDYKPSFKVRYRNFCAHNRTFGSKIKRICIVMLRPLARPFRRRIEGLLDNLEKNICDFVEDKTWDRYLRLSAELKKEYELAFMQMQSEINRLQEQLGVVSGTVDARILQAEQGINQTLDGQIWKAVQALTASTDERIWKAEQELTASTDARIWKAEQALTASTDTRIWKAEQALAASTDARIWKGELNLLSAIEMQAYKALKLMPQRRLAHLTVHLVEHCNLNCQCCDNFSPLASEEYADVAEMSRDFERLAELGGEIGYIELSGGEALLHPKIVEFISVARSNFSSTEIHIVSNGMLLPQMPDGFWKACADNNIIIVITKYPINLQIDAMEEKTRMFGVRWRYYDDTEEKTSFLAPFDLKGSQNKDRNFVNCFHANCCVYLKHGRIYSCSIAANVRHFNKYFDEHLPDGPENSISIYEATSMQQILDFISKPIPLCKYCDVTGRCFGLPWNTSKRRKGEWVSGIDDDEEKFIPE